MLTLIGILDGNGSGTEGAKLGPGVNVGHPDVLAQPGRDRPRGCGRRAGQPSVRRRQGPGDGRRAVRTVSVRQAEQAIAPGATRSCRRSKSNSVRPRAPTRRARSRSSRSSTSAAVSSTGACGCSMPRPICAAPRSRSNAASAVRAATLRTSCAFVVSSVAFVMHPDGLGCSAGPSSSTAKETPATVATSTHRSRSLDDHADGGRRQAARHPDRRREDRRRGGHADAGRRSGRARGPQRGRDRTGRRHADGTAGAAAGRARRRGDRLMTIAPLVPAERDQRIEAQRAVTSAEAEELAARQRLQRLEQLLKDGAASVRSVEEARAQHQVTVAALTAARERLTGARESGRRAGRAGRVGAVRRHRAEHLRGARTDGRRVRPPPRDRAGRHAVGPCRVYAGDAADRPRAAGGGARSSARRHAGPGTPVARRSEAIPRRRPWICYYAVANAGARCARANVCSSSFR